eukprot:g41988.t1
MVPSLQNHVTILWRHPFSTGAASPAFGLRWADLGNAAVTEAAECGERGHWVQPRFPLPLGTNSASDVPVTLTLSEISVDGRNKSPKQQPSNPYHAWRLASSPPCLQTMLGFTLRITRLGDRSRAPGREDAMPGNCPAVLGGCYSRPGGCHECRVAATGGRLSSPEDGSRHQTLGEKKEKVTKRIKEKKKKNGRSERAPADASYSAVILDQYR